jgi:hypothetical protein
MEGPTMTRAEAQEVASKVRTMMWKLSMSGWRNNPDLMRLLPYAALYYCGARGIEWISKLPISTAKAIIANKP